MNNKLKFILHSKVLPLLILILLITIFFWKGFLPGWNNINSDFPNYYTSSKLLVEGKSLDNIYDDVWFQNQINLYGINEEGKFSPFPPVTSFVMLIPSYFNPLMAKRIYLVFNLILLIVIAILLFKITKIPFINCLILIFLSGVGLFNNFLLGQFYIILMFLIVLGYYLFIKNQHSLSGMILSIGVSIKYLPIIYLPIFLRRKRLNVIIGILIGLLLLNLLGIYFIGFEVYKEYFSSALLPHLNGKLSNQSSFAFQFQSWDSLFRNFFVYDNIENTNPIFNWEPGYFIAKGFIFLLVIFTTAYTYKKLLGSPNELSMSIGLLTITALLLAPATASYHFILLVIPTIFLLDSKFPVKSRNSVYTLIIIYSLIGFAPIILNRIIPDYEKNIFFSFHRLWLVVIYFTIYIKILLIDIKNRIKIINP